MKFLKEMRTMKFCTKCGAVMEDDARFCTNCGQVVEDETAGAAGMAAGAAGMAAGAAQQGYAEANNAYQQAAPQMNNAYQQPVNNAYQANVPPTYNAAAQPQRTLVFGRLSFIFGLIGLILSGLFGIIGLFTAGIVGIYCWFGICLGIAGLIMGIVGKKKNPDDPKARKGFLLSLLAIIIGFVLFIIGMIILASLASNY